jgi:ParB family chromosome partitioning protein
MSKKANLGKGLEALISQYSTDNDSSYINDSIPLSRIKANPNQPRKDFDDSKMEELISSIKEKGILQPIAVRELKNGDYEIIAGERRYRAAQSAGLESIPAYILSVSNESEIMEYALIENIQRVDLDPIEESEAFALLKSKYNLSQKEISKRVGKSRSLIANSLRLLKLPNSIKKDIKANKLTMGHAISLLGLKNKTQMLAIANRIINNKLSVRNTEEIVSKINSSSNKKIKVKKSSKSKLINDLESKLIHKYGTKVSVLYNNTNKGRIIFEYYSQDDLERILDLLHK